VVVQYASLRFSSALSGKEEDAKSIDLKRRLLVSGIVVCVAMVVLGGYLYRSRPCSQSTRATRE
jgi:hypothetical protein